MELVTTSVKNYMRKTSNLNESIQYILALENTLVVTQCECIRMPNVINTPIQNTLSGDRNN